MNVFFFLADIVWVRLTVALLDVVGQIMMMTALLSRIRPIGLLLS
jgi:hypothetical protein